MAHNNTRVLATGLPSADDEALEARYGHKRARRMDRWLLGGLAGLVALVLVGWVIWATFSGSGTTLDVQDTAHNVVDDHTVTVTFEVSVQAGTGVICAVQALNEQFAVVGWKIVDIPPADTFTRSITETVRTSAPANTGLINHCWLA
ncbi:hypothetical protein GCM10027416_10750 [Okibacterium endophyticum]